MNGKIPFLLRPFAAILVVCASIITIGFASVGIMMGVYYGLVGMFLTHVHSGTNLVIMVIGGAFAACIGLFLGFRVIQTGSLDADVLTPSRFQDRNKIRQPQAPMSEGMERRVMAGEFSWASLQRNYYEEHRYNDYEEALKSERHASRVNSGPPPPLMHLRLARIYLSFLSRSVRGVGTQIYDDTPRRVMLRDLGYSIDQLKDLATFHFERCHDAQHENEKAKGLRAANDLTTEAFQEYDTEREFVRDKGALA